MKSSKIPRRDFIKKTAAVGVGLSVAGSRMIRGENGSSPLHAKPNILLILVDQDRYPVHTPALNRPNLDRLKNTGVVFTDNYCSYPLCSPSRSTIMTGRYPHQVGVLTNIDFFAHNPTLDPDIPNIGKVFSGAGYETAYFGKWHLTHHSHLGQAMKRYGFDMMEISNEAIAYGSDARTCEKAARWIRRQRDGKKPWLCITAPINPHDICFPQLRSSYGKIPDYPVSMPLNFIDDAGKIYPPFADYLRSISASKMLQHSEADWISYLRYYCFLTELVDKHIGIMLEALDESGQIENTVVVYTADHGEMGGSHGLINKSTAMYEEQVHIPFVMSRLSNNAGGAMYDGLTSNIDIVPTLCGIAGIKWPVDALREAPLQGVDLSPVLDGKELNKRDTIFITGMGELELVPPWRGLRARNYAYWHYIDGTEFMFDLAKDPGEVNNLANDPDHKDLKLEFRDKVRKFRIQTIDPFREFLA